MSCSTASASHARVSDYCSLSITLSTNLLDHERPLSDGLETLATTPSAGCGRSAWLSSSSLASSADICTTKTDIFLRTIDSFHKLNLQIHDNVLSLSLHLLASTTLISTKHLLEFLEDVAEPSLTSTTSLCLSKLLREAFEASETLAASSERSTSTEWALAPKRILSLLITSHSCLIVNSALALITESLVGIVDFRELLLGFLARVDIGMVLLSKLKVTLLDVVLVCASVDSKQVVVIFLLISTTPSSSAATSPGEASVLSGYDRYRFRSDWSAHTKEAHGSRLSYERGRECPHLAGGSR